MSKTICPKCGTISQRKNPGNSCPECGTDMVEYYDNTGYGFCKTCGHEIERNWNVCPNCGKDPEEGIDSGGGCFITTACTEAKGLSDECSELTTLRAFREDYVRSLENGNEIINEYYIIAPRILSEIDRTDNNREIYIELYEQLVLKSLELIKSGKEYEAFNNYLQIVENLKERYLQ